MSLDDRLMVALPLAVLLCSLALAIYAFRPRRGFAWKVAGGSSLMLFAVTLASMTAPCVDAIFLHPGGELNFCAPRMVVFADPFLSWKWATAALHH